MLYQVLANPPTMDLTVFIRDVPPELDRFPDLAALP